MLNITLDEAKRLCNNYKNSEPEHDQSIFYPVSLYGFIHDKYTNSNEIATHLLLSRSVINIEEQSRITSLDILKIEFNGLPEHNQYIKKYLKNSIVSLVELNIINIQFVNEGEGTLEKRLGKGEAFTFTQTLEIKEENEKPMYFRFFESHFKQLITREAFETMRKRVGNTEHGVSIKFDYLACYGAIANSMNAPFKDEYIESRTSDKTGINEAKEFIKLYGAGVNFAGQEYLASKTAPTPKNKKSRVGLERMNIIDQSLREDFNIFWHVKVRRFGNPNWKYSILRSFMHETELMYKMIEWEVTKSIREMSRYGALNKHSIVNILPIEKLSMEEDELIKEANFEESAEVEDETKTKEENLDHKVGFPNFENVNEDKKILPLGQAEEKVNKNKPTFINNYNANEVKSTPLIAKEWHKISDANKQYLILKETIKRHKNIGLAYLDAFEVENAYKNKNYSMINQIFNGNIKHQIITNEDFEQAIINNPDKNLGYYAAQQKVVRIYDQQPYDEKESDFDKLINEVRSLIK